MGAIWISMRPMYNAPFLIPFILPRELYGIAFAERADPCRYVNIVCNQKCLAGTKGNDEFLMLAANIVVWQQSCDDAFSGDLNIALML